MDNRNDKNFLQTIAVFLAGFGIGKSVGANQKKKKGRLLLVVAVVVILTVIFWPSEADKTYSRIQWPDNELATLIPTPKLKAGSVNYESETYLHIEVKVSQKEFDAYVESCRGSGFTVDYYRDDDTYQAKDEIGNYLWLSYDSKERVMGIHLDRVKEDDPEPGLGEGIGGSSETDPPEDTANQSLALADNQAATPLASADCAYKNYSEIVSQFEQAGFTDIRTEAVPDLVNGWLVYDGDVKEILIGEATQFGQYAVFDKSEPVLIRYHTFPESEPNVSSQEPPELVVDDILTVDSCEELASILTLKAEIDPAYSAFARTYKDRTIEFDGCITYIINHENYNTRYDLLLSAGDYVDENTANPGPIFKFEDVNTSDLGIEDLFLPEFVKVGSNVRITARVVEFNDSSGLFILDPVLVEAK